MNMKDNGARIPVLQHVTLMRNAWSPTPILLKKLKINKKLYSPMTSTSR